MDRFIMNFMLFLEVHFGKQINNPPLRWWIERNEGTFKEVRIISDFNTIVFTNAAKVRVRGRHHHKPVFIINRNEIGLKVDPENGRVKMWEKRSTNRPGKDPYMTVNYSTFSQRMENFKVNVYKPEEPGNFWGRDVDYSYIPLLDEFLALHGVTTMEELAIPAAEALGIPANTDYTNERAPWMDHALGARNLAEFWTRMGKTVKLAKDEKRALIAMIKVNPKYMVFARIATRIHIPNIRTLTPPVADPRRGGLHGDVWFYTQVNADAVNKWMMGLRKVTPNRRVMFMQDWSRQSVDVLNMLADQWRAGDKELVNFPSVEEYHRHLTHAARLARVVLEQIPEVKGEFWTPRIRHAIDNGELTVVTEKRSVDRLIIGNNIEVVVPTNTHMVTEWGMTQGHCIGSYARQAARGETILLGFWRDGDWVGHCSIERRRCVQLLAKFNAHLQGPDREAILNWMVMVKLIDRAETGWG